MMTNICNLHKAEKERAICIKDKHQNKMTNRTQLIQTLNIYI